MSLKSEAYCVGDELAAVYRVGFSQPRVPSPWAALSALMREINPCCYRCGLWVVKGERGEGKGERGEEGGYSEQWVTVTGLRSVWVCLGLRVAYPILSYLSPE